MCVICFYKHNWNLGDVYIHNPRGLIIGATNEPMIEITQIDYLIRKTTRQEVTRFLVKI